MCCFLVPLAQAVTTSIWRKTHAAAIADPESSPLLRQLPSLEKMLWGGTLMLIVDHVISGELTWRFPFFTALARDGGGGVMLREILTVGVPMSLVLTAAWALWAFMKARHGKLNASNI